MIRFTDITDRASFTFMVGEIPESRLVHGRSEDVGDESSAVWLRQRRFSRDGTGSALRDTRGLADTTRFGNAPSGGFQMSLCDGSVRMIAYTIDQTTYSRLATRRGGLPVADY